MSSVSGSTGLPIDSLITKNQTAPPVASTLDQQLGEDAFLKLLTTQLQNQDPLKPMDDTQSIAQLAQFSAVQSTNELKSSFASFQSNFAVMQSAGLIGKTVSAQSSDGNGNAITVNGTVKTISIVDGTPEFTMVDGSGNLLVDGKGQPLQIPTSAILSIG